MSERRRRRLDDEPRGGLPLFPLVLVVVLAGLLMGGVLAHFFGGSKSAPRAAPTVVAASLPSPAATPAPIPTTPMPKITPVPSPSASPSATPSPAASRTPASKSPPPSIPPPRPKTPPVASKTLAVAAAPATHPPVASKTLAVAAAPATHPPSVSSDDRAGALVRSYLEALAHGDRSGASSYLASGTPNETFMTPDSHIESIRSSSVGPQQYRVTADVQTASGEYYVTFTVEQSPGGLSITDHFSIKTQ